MAIVLEKYMTTGYCDGPQAPGRSPNNLVVGFFLGYVAPWNERIIEGHSNRIRYQGYLEPYPNILIVRNFSVRGSDENLNLRMRWGIVENVERSIGHFRPQGVTRTIDLCDPMDPPAIKWAHFTYVYSSQYARLDSHGWNGVLEYKNLNIAVGGNRVVYFLFDGLTLNDPIYLYTTFERRLNRPEVSNNGCN